MNPDVKTHRTEVQLRFADIDMLKHVNNARFATFMEIARIAFFNDVIASRHDWTKVGLIVARLETDFREPVFFHEKLYVDSYVSHMGNKSMTIDYNFVTLSEKGETLKATGRSVMVSFDYRENKSIPVPQEWKDALESWSKS